LAAPTEYIDIPLANDNNSHCDLPIGLKRCCCGLIRTGNVGHQPLKIKRK
jgi:hypothetical protein